MAPDLSEVRRNVEASLTGSPDVVVRLYRNMPDSAILAFGYEADVFEEHGYYPRSVTWTPGEWGHWVVVVAVLLLVVAIGALFLAYMLIRKPPGTLVVIYQRGAS